MAIEFRNQPPGVYLMFATEIWERFSYYGFMGIVVLFMVSAPTNGGLGYDRGAALLMFGVVTSMIWIAPLFGGYFADRVIGARRAVGCGCGGLALGNFCLAASSLEAQFNSQEWAHALFFVGIIVLIIGAGLFKSNASALLSSLFRPSDDRRESGFVLFYMGINIGALAAPFGAGTLGEKVGWAWGFGVAGLGMLIGLAIFTWKVNDYFSSVVAEDDVPEVKKKLHLASDRNVHLILMMALFTIIYMTGQMTYGGIMNIYAYDQLDRDIWGVIIPSTWFLSLNPLLIIVLGSMVANFWQRRDLKSSRIIFVEKITLGLILMGTAFGFLVICESIYDGLKSPLVLIGFYALITIAELCVLPAGLAEISRRAPSGAVGLMMGVWIVTMGIGSFFAGYLGVLTTTVSLQFVFAILCACGIGAGILLFVAEPFVRKYMNEPLSKF